MRRISTSLQDMRSALGVGVEGAKRVVITGSDKCLRSQVQHNIWLALFDGLVDPLWRSDVCTRVAGKEPGCASTLEMAAALRIEGQAVDFSTQKMQPMAQPTAFETGVTRNQHAPTLPK